MSCDVIISVKSVSKRYEIYNNPLDRLKQFILPKIHERFGIGRELYFKDFWALKDVSFEVRRGETVGIIGRNGAGKSTLLQLICGTLTPTSGSIEIKGKVAALLELGIGFNKEFTGRENVYLKAAVFGLTKKEVEERFENIVEFSGIREFIDQPVKNYSSGMYVRLAFSVVAHVDAEILIIDEALSVGDAYFVQKCMRFLRDFMKRGTVLFVSHDSGAILNLCDSAILLERGEVKRSGSPKSIIESYLEELAFSSVQKIVNKKNEKAYEAVSEDNEIKKRSFDEFINSTNLRNDIQVFNFIGSSTDFGAGGATIESVRLNNNNDKAVTHLIGGERVSLVIEGVTHSAISNGIVGFALKDRLGQNLFGDNTFLRLMEEDTSFQAGQRFRAIFTFMMPLLPVGDYSFNVAFAEGTQINHIQHHWINDALILRSLSTSVSTGLIGINMEDVSLNRI